MADILDFRPAEGRSGRRSRGGAGATACEVVIFPGIRYERWETAPPERPKAKSRRVRRDTLEIKD